jgi:hypothetical protein
MPFLRHLPSRPPFGWSLLLSASLPPPARLILSPRAAAAHPLSSLCLAWLDAMCACPHLQLLIYRSASALLQRSRKTTREGDSQVLSQQQVVLLEVAALGLMRWAGTGRRACQPVVCCDTAVAAVLQLKPTSASCAADFGDNQRSLAFILQQTIACLSPTPGNSSRAINIVALLPDESSTLHLTFADCSESLLLLVCSCNDRASLPHSFTASISKCKYTLGCSTCCAQDDGTFTTAALYIQEVKHAIQMDDVFLGASELSYLLDSCYDDIDHDADSASPVGFFISPDPDPSSLSSSLHLSALSSSSVTKDAAARRLYSVSCLSIHCIGLVPLNSPRVQIILHALLRGQLQNLVSLSLQLLPASIILPDLHVNLSCLVCLQHLNLVFDHCGSSESASIMRAIAHQPLLRSLHLQGLDLSSLVLPSARFTIAAPISILCFRDVGPPSAAAAAAVGTNSSDASSMAVCDMALVVGACSSTLQSLTISGKQDIPYEQQIGSWRLLLHATAHCSLLQTLDVSKSGIDAIGCVGLAFCLQRLVLLLKLDVSGNPLAATRLPPGTNNMVEIGAGAHLLAHSLRGLTRLKSLLVKKCCMNRCGVVALLQALNAHSSLTQLAVGGNHYSGLPHPVHELAVIKEGLSRMTCAPSPAAEYDALQGYAEAIRTVYSEGESHEHAVAALQAALGPVNMGSLATQLLQPSLHCPPATLPQLLIGVISNNSALASLNLANLSLPFETLPLLTRAWKQQVMPPIFFGDFRCRVDASAGRARQVADAWATLVQAASESYEKRGRRMPRTLRWPSFLVDAVEEPVT